MKKTIKLFVALSIVATLLSGCITATVLMTKWAIDEQKEIKSGKKASTLYEILSFDHAKNNPYKRITGSKV